jgi:predicted adenylyl cyclase CyaB
MPRNVEIKARVNGWDELHQQSAALAGRGPEKLEQEDIFFAVPRGRLKLRTQNGKAELIYYFRENTPVPRESSYLVIPIPDPAAARKMLALVHGQRGIIRKTRWLYLAGQTRIHLDRVEGLGDFLELEVVLRDGQSLEEGTAIAQSLMRRLKIRNNQLVDRAYIDFQTSNSSIGGGLSEAGPADGVLFPEFQPE